MVDAVMKVAAGSPIRARAPVWLGLLILAIGLVAPDCCLTGHHAFGAGMDRFGAICRSRA